MTTTFQIVKHSPNNIEEIKMENVASYEVLDNKIVVKFNGEPDETITLVNNEEGTLGEWFGINIFNTRIGLKVKL